MPQDTKPQDTRVKALASFEIKDEATGEVEAIIATLNVVDKDFEVILPGAIKDGSKVKMSAYGHAAMYGEAPVGKGTLTVEDNKAVFRGEFFLSTQRGREAFETIKALGSDNEWSFGFHVLGSEIPDEEWRQKGARRMLTKLDVFEVSPVIVGAGIGTRTVAAKCEGCGGPTCRCPTEQHDPAVQQAVADFKRRQAWLECLKERDGFSAWDVAESVYRRESRGAIQRGPIVRFYDYGQHGKRAGYYDPARPDEIFISRGMPFEEVLSVAAHEAHHAWACWDPSEESAAQAAKYTIQRYMQKFDLAGGRCGH